MPLVVRQQQLAVFEALAVERYVERITLHLQKFFPEACDQLGVEGVRKVIREGMARAQGYGLRSELEIARFIDAMYLCRPDFDTHPAYRWAHRILTDKTLRAGAKMEQIYERILAAAKGP